MKFSFQSQSYFRLVQAAALCVGLLFFGCKDTRPRTVETTPRPALQPAVSEEVPMSETSKEPVAAKSPVASQPTEPEKPAPSDPAELAKEFRATTEPDRRGELVEALWSLDTPAAVESLRQLYLIEREPDVKIDIIAGLSDSKKPETREARFGLVVMALAVGQPKDIRELAAQMLVDFDDPRAISLLQQYSQDADPEMREAAQEALETRKAAAEE